MIDTKIGTRRLKLIALVTILVFLVCAPLYNAAAGETVNREKDFIYQYSTIDALLKGLYDGNMTIARMSDYGNLGLGTFNTLDGEMVILDGQVLKIKAADGMAYKVPWNEKTPYFMITNFTAESSATLKKPLDFAGLQKYLDGLRPSENLFYAFRIEGSFSYVKTRSVPPQKKPYRPLAEVVKTQPTFEFKDIEGYLVGFWSPAYMNGICPIGYHFHFITKDKKRGGHVLRVKVSEIKIDIDHINGFRMLLPNSEAFLKMKL